MSTLLAPIILISALTMGSVAAQSTPSQIAPTNAPSTATVATAGARDTVLHVSGTVVDQAGAPIAGASLYIYQTDAEGYYGVKPASDSRNPRLKALLRSDSKGAFSFDTIKPGSYPNSKAPAHIHFEVAATGFASKIFEIVFERDPFVTADMRRNPAFSVRPIESGGRVTQEIRLERSR